MLSAEDLSYYSFKAITTFGTSSDFKHFLPRICELIASGPYPKNIEIVLSRKLWTADFANWPEPERSAVEQFLLALWDDTLRRWPALNQADTVLHSLASIRTSLTTPLDTWSALMRTERNARLHLANWLCYGPGWSDPPVFWNDFPGAWNEILDWLGSSPTSAAVDVAFVEWSKTPEGEHWGYRRDEYRATCPRVS